MDRLKKLGEIQRRAPKGQKNSQAKGPVSDDTLESSKEAAPKKQPDIRESFRLVYTERKTKELVLRSFYIPKRRKS